MQLVIVTRKLNATETKRDFDESYNQDDEQQSTLSIWIELWASWLGLKDCWNLFALSKWEFTIFVLAIVHRPMYTMYIHEYCLLFTVFCHIKCLNIHTEKCHSSSKPMKHSTQLNSNTHYVTWENSHVFTNSKFCCELQEFIWANFEWKNIKQHQPSC